MTERERQQAIDILQAGGHLACAGLIEKFVWANTSKPRFPYGAPVQIRTQLEIERTVSDKELGQAIEVAREETVVGKITRLEMSSAPIIRMPSTTVTAVSTASSVS